MSKIPPKLGKGFYLLIKGSFGIPSQWDSMQREFSESSLKINSTGGRGEKAQRKILRDHVPLIEVFTWDEKYLNAH